MTQIQTATVLANRCAEVDTCPASAASTLLVVLLTSVLTLPWMSCGGRVQSAGSTPDGSDTIQRTDFLEAVQTAICDGAEACCAATGRQRLAACKEQVERVWQPRLQHAEQVGASYDPARAALCVSELKFEWLGCASRKQAVSTSDDACARVFSSPEPRKRPGESCTGAMDCEQPVEASVLCTVVDTPPGTCVRHDWGTEGAPCGGTEGAVSPACRAPFVCGASHTCQRRFRAGEICVSLGSDGCESGWVCHRDAGDTCVKATPIGAQASTQYECEGYCLVNGRCRVCPDLPIQLYCE